MNRKKICLAIIFLCFITCPFSAVATSSDQGLTFKEYLDKANDYIKSYRHFEAADALKEATKLGGSKHPSLHMRLGILYYGLGLIPEAIAEGEKAVSLAPSSKWYKYDLAKFYYVDKQFNKAEKQFITLLKLDPGFTLGYYYLAELYYQKKEYDMAWLSLERARRLGHQGKHLKSKLGTLTSKPKENFELASQDSKLFRFIKLESPELAKQVLDEIWRGKLFENLELELKKEKNGSADFGVMMLSELKEDVAASLKGNKPFSEPMIVRTGPDYRIMQRIVPFSPENWKTNIASGSKTKELAPAVVATKQQPKSKPVAKQQAEETSQATVAASATQEVHIQEKQDTSAEVASSTSDEEQLSNKLAAFYALENWVAAWESQDIEEYLMTYSSQFQPSGNQTIDAWKKKRNRSLSRPTYIKLKVEDPVVETLSANQLLLTFKQSYESNTYKDVVIKTLTMAKEGDGWKIIKEREVKKLQ